MNKLIRNITALTIGAIIAASAFAGLETATYIDDLVSTNPLTTDAASQGDDHIRLIKSTIQATFPNINGPVSTSDENLSNVAVTNAANVFTNGTQEIQSSAPRWILDSSGATSNERLWHIQNSSGGDLVIQTRTDADGSGNSAVSIGRTGTTVDSIALSSTTLTHNGSTIWTVANDGSGSTLDADLLDGNSSAYFRDMGNVNAGTLAVARGGTGVTSSTGTGNVVLSASPTLSGTLTASFGIFAAEATNSQGSLAVAANRPEIHIAENDGAANNRRWDFSAQSEQLRLSASNDAGTTVTNWMTVDRTSTAVDLIAMSATDVTINGSSVCTEDGTNCPVSSDFDTAAARVSSAGSLETNDINVTSAARNSVGDYTVTFSSSFSAVPICTASVYGTSPAVAIIEVATTSAVTVNTVIVNGTGAFVLDDRAFTVNCFSN